MNQHIITTKGISLSHQLLHSGGNIKKNYWTSWRTKRWWWSPWQYGAFRQIWNVHKPNPPHCPCAGISILSLLLPYGKHYTSITCVFISPHGQWGKENLTLFIETTVSIVTLHVGLKIFILQDPTLALGREALDTLEPFYLTPYLKHTNGQRHWRLLSDYWWNTIVVFYIISVNCLCIIFCLVIF